MTALPAVCNTLVVEYNKTGLLQELQFSVQCKKSIRLLNIFCFEEGYLKKNVEKQWLNIMRSVVERYVVKNDVKFWLSFVLHLTNNKTQF